MSPKILRMRFFLLPTVAGAFALLAIKEFSLLFRRPMPPA
jgi:hypothetical protein